jgi:hypothetical protein
MGRVTGAAVGTAKLASGECASLVAAYREGLGLACIAIISEAAGPRIVVITAGGGDPDAQTDAQIRWWCRRTAEAERVASAAGRRMRRLESRNAGLSSSPERVAEDLHALSLARDAVLAAARRLNVLLQSDDEIAAEAALVAARVAEEMQRLQQSGGLKSVNQAYRSYRLEATARGERVARYADWMRKYKENLVRQAASALRDM